MAASMESAMATAGRTTKGARAGRPRPGVEGCTLAIRAGVARRGGSAGRPAGSPTPRVAAICRIRSAGRRLLAFAALSLLPALPGAGGLAHAQEPPIKVGFDKNLYEVTEGASTGWAVLLATTAGDKPTQDFAVIVRPIIGTATEADFCLREHTVTFRADAFVAPTDEGSIRELGGIRAPGGTSHVGFVIVPLGIRADGIIEEHESFLLEVAHAPGHPDLVLVQSHDGGARPRVEIGTNPTETTANREAACRIDDRRDEPVPAAFLTRFGRTVGAQVVDAVTARLEGGGGSHVTGGGRALTAWGRVVTGSFDADVEGVELSGDVTTGILGADFSRGAWVAGAALSRSLGEGSFTPGDGAASSRDRGVVESTLTSVFPYARVNLGERISAWGLAGYGTGSLTFSRAGRAPVETETGMTMGAIGVRGEVLAPAEAHDLSLAVRSDLFRVRMTSDEAPRLEASETDASRLRFVLDASRPFEAGGGATLTPRLELGLRHDGGDAETGVGMEAGGGIRYARAGLTIEGTVRTLVAHEASDYEEWGAGGSVAIDPGTSGRGLSLTLASAWGAASSGVERMWSLPNADGLATGDGGFEAGRRLDAELGYGLGNRRGPGSGLVTPYAGLRLAGGDERAWRLGARWEVAPEGVTLGLEGTRRERAGEAPAQGLTLRGALRW